VLAAFLVVHANGGSHADALQGGSANSDEKGAQAVTAPPSAQRETSILPASLLTTLVDTAAKVDASSAAELRRQLASLPADLNDRAAQAAALQLASQAQQSIIDAFVQARRREGGQAPPEEAGSADRGWTPLNGSAVAIALSVASLLISLISFFVLRSATRRALMAAGLL